MGSQYLHERRTSGNQFTEAHQYRDDSLHHEGGRKKAGTVQGPPVKKRVQRRLSSGVSSLEMWEDVLER